MGVLVDLTPLRRFPQFRRIWIGYVIFLLGSQITIVAVVYEIYLMTRSSLDVGLVSLVHHRRCFLDGEIYPGFSPLSGRSST
ncbi:MAG TPA: hypothetical protein VMU99_09275 [Acidimicrobiales bacterium]|nr:hypothetical protein [Acidimicrobiales bacterium]